MLAWSFGYVLPSWERRSVPDAIARALRDLSDYAAHSLRAGSGDAVDERLARRKAYESLAALGAALSRSRVEPRGVRLPIKRVASLLDHGERFLAHLSLVRHSLARLDDAAELRRVDASLADTIEAIRACLDLRSSDEAIAQHAAVEAASGADAELLPAQPPTADVVPWLSRRLCPAHPTRRATSAAAAQASLAAPHRLRQARNTLGAAQAGITPREHRTRHPHPSARRCRHRPHPAGRRHPTSISRASPSPA